MEKFTVLSRAENFELNWIIVFRWSLPPAFPPVFDKILNQNGLGQIIVYLFLLKIIKWWP